MPTKPVLADLMDEVGRSQALDQGARVLADVAESIVENDAVRDLLRAGNVTGSPIHPALVHFPIGGAFSAALVDALGMRVAATVITGFTAVTALPTAVAGLSDYATEEDAAGRRVGFAHAIAAAGGTTLTLASLLARGAGNRGLARTLLWGACAAYGAAGALGGHLVYALEEGEAGGDEFADQGEAAAAQPDAG